MNLQIHRRLRTCRRFARVVPLALAIAVLAPVARARPLPTVEFERLTWTEIRDALAAGCTTIIIPVGGTEQSGPYMAVGKHNVRVAALSDQIARALGNALVAPVVAYVPEGGTNPRTGHMLFPGTITVPTPVFTALIRSAAESFRVQGFHTIVLLGDHGGYQTDLAATADQLNRGWAGTDAKAVYVGAYYDVVETQFNDALRSRGYGADIGSHADLDDTALMLAVDPTMVRQRALQAAPKPTATDGVYGGDPRPATAELGRIGTQMQVQAAVDAIRRAEHQSRGE